MRVLVIGAGSIGSRRARILAEMGHTVAVADASWAALKPLRDDCYALYPSAAHALADDAERWDAVFICTPADTHVRLAFDCIQADKHPRGLFIEKPLSVDGRGLDELAAVTEALGIVTMGACNMRWAYRAIPRGRPPHRLALLTSGPLSGWRPGAETYRTHGIVLESAIHDMDLATYLLGSIEGIEVVEADEGYVDLRTRHPEGRRARIVNDWREGSEVARRLTAIDDRGEWDGFAADTSDTMYRDEMAYFLEAVEQGKPEHVDNSLRCAAETLGWALRVKEQTMGVRV